MSNIYTENLADYVNVTYVIELMRILKSLKEDDPLYHKKEVLTLILDKLSDVSFKVKSIPLKVSLQDIMSGKSLSECINDPGTNATNTNDVSSWDKDSNSDLEVDTGGSESLPYTSEFITNYGEYNPEENYEQDYYYNYNSSEQVNDFSEVHTTNSSEQVNNYNEAYSQKNNKQSLKDISPYLKCKDEIYLTKNGRKTKKVKYF